jgi:hypothetical protein
MEAKMDANLKQIKTQSRFACPAFRCFSFAQAITGRVDPAHPEPLQQCPENHKLDEFGNLGDHHFQTELFFNEMNVYRLAKVGYVADIKQLSIGDVLLMTVCGQTDPFECPVHWSVYFGKEKFISKLGSEGVETLSWNEMMEKYAGCKPSSVMWRVVFPS